MNYSKTNERLAINLRGKINDIRDNNENWKNDEDILEMLNDIESVGYFYDEDSWDVYANDDEYYDETPLELYVNDDEFNDDEDDEYYNSSKNNFGWNDDDDF